MTDIIKISKLCKSFGKIKAVDDLSFEVKEGELLAFLGVNGAGKSTTISIICGQLKQDSGSVMVGGASISEDPEKIKRDIGVVFQNSVLDKALTVKDNLYCRAALYGIRGDDAEKRVKELSEMFELSALMERQLGKLSGGQRRRIDIARALIHSPKILILDEPTTGLDPQTRQLLWETITKLRKNNGLTVLLTTHYMEEAADADRVVIIDSGRIAARGTPHELKNRFTGDYITLYGIEEKQIKAIGVPYERVGSAYKINVKNTSEATSIIIENPNLFFDYEITKGKMDDVFLAATGKRLEEKQDAFKERRTKR